MAGVVIPFVMAPIHHGHIRGWEFLAAVGSKLRQRRIGDQLADVVDGRQYALLIAGIQQVMENGAGYNGKPVFTQFCGYRGYVNR